MSVKRIPSSDTEDGLLRRSHKQLKSLLNNAHKSGDDPNQAALIENVMQDRFERSQTLLRLEALMLGSVNPPSPELSDRVAVTEHFRAFYNPDWKQRGGGTVNAAMALQSLSKFFPGQALPGAPISQTTHFTAADFFDFLSPEQIEETLGSSDSGVQAVYPSREDLELSPLGTHAWDFADGVGQSHPNLSNYPFALEADSPLGFGKPSPLTKEQLEEVLDCVRSMLEPGDADLDDPSGPDGPDLPGKHI